MAGRLLQGESRLLAGRESSAPIQHSHSSSCVGTQLMGTRDTNPAFLGLGDPQGVHIRAHQSQPGRTRGPKVAAGRCRVPQNSQMRGPDTQADRERYVTVVPGRRTTGFQDNRSQQSRGGNCMSWSVGSHMCSAQTTGPGQPPGVLGDEEGDLGPPEATHPPTRATQTGWGLNRRGLGCTFNLGLTRTDVCAV